MSIEPRPGGRERDLIEGETSRLLKKNGKRFLKIIFTKYHFYMCGILSSGIGKNSRVNSCKSFDKIL